MTVDEAALARSLQRVLEEGMAAGVTEFNAASLARVAVRNYAEDPEVRQHIVDQPPPIPNESVPVWDLVIADMKERDRVGRERYGTPLQSFNGRDALVDGYQEILDLAVYVRQEIAERDDHLVNALALVYTRDEQFPSSAVASACDEVLDRSGRLLGRVRDRAREMRA